jgi:GNAT superfamily N-acetyltransferase
VEIRPARRDELALLQDLEVAAGQLFRAIGMDAVADDPPPTVEELASAAAVLVAVDGGGVPVGYARIEVLDGHAHLEQLSVLPEHGGRGIGTALLDAVAGWAAARGDGEITLTTFRDVPFNSPLYLRRGYEELADEDRGPELVEQMRVEAAHGLDPTTRVAMRRRL